MENSGVKKYINRQKTPYNEICKELRRIIFKTFPDIKEEMKWGVPTYSDGIYYIVALRDHVNLGLSLESIPKDKLDLFSGSGKTMRHIEIKALDQIDEKQISELLKMAHRVEDG